MRRVTTIAFGLLIMLALFAQGASAVPLYSGPWEKGHEPPTINHPELLAGGVGGGTFSVFPYTPNDPSEFCPSAWAVTLQDQTGSITWSMVDVKEKNFCKRSATQSMTGAPSFTSTNNYGSITNFSFVNPPSQEWPVLYIVTDAADQVIAQGSYTLINGTFRVNSGSPNFESICLDGHHQLYSDPTTGVVYCMNTATFFRAGWPTPPAPAAPPLQIAAPAVKTPVSKPRKRCPKGRRKVRRAGRVRCVKVRHRHHRHRAA